ncbi:MAG TPA: hypothetical protein VGD98_14385 [Ktedonobacteraceae bacterium]
MPNKYEREIEEILRNLERTEPKASLGQRVNRRLHRKPGPRRTISLPQLSFPEWCLVLALVAALAAGGWAQAHGQGDLITGSIALLGALCVGVVAFSNFVRRPRYQTPTRFNNVTPLRRNPLRSLSTRWHLLMLKLRYRKRNNREN